MNKQVGKNCHFLQSVRHALDGIYTTFSEERNFRFDVVAACVVIVLAIVFQINLAEWCWLLLCIFLMLVLEMLNTVVEQLVDLMVEHRYHIAAKKAKDVAAGVVLLGAIFVLCIACMIFVPKFITLITH